MSIIKRWHYHQNNLKRKWSDDNGCTRKEANSWLSNISNYQRLNIDLTELHNGKIKIAINNYKDAEQISSSKNGILSEKVKTSVFHLLLKIHKRNNPGKTDVSLVDCHTSRICKFDYHYPQPAMTDRQSYVKQKTDFIEK